MLTEAGQWGQKPDGRSSLGLAVRAEECPRDGRGLSGGVGGPEGGNRKMQVWEREMLVERGPGEAGRDGS